MTWDVTMEPLVDAKKTEEEGRHFVGGGAAFSLPKEGCQIVSVGKDSTFADIKKFAPKLRERRPPASSKSEFEIVPDGFSSATRLLIMLGHL